jgi:hypothetical protein
MPKNFLHNYAKSIVRDKEAQNTHVYDSEVQYTGNQIYPHRSDGSLDHYQTMSVHFIYPPEFMYGDGNTKYDYPGTGDNLQLELIDAAMLKLNLTVHGNYASGSYGEGDYVETTVHGNLYATAAPQYYNSGSQTTTLESIFGNNPFGKIRECKHIDTGDTSTLIITPRQTGDGTNTEGKDITSSIMDYASLEVEGAQNEEGYRATPQECFFLVTEDTFMDITKFSYNTSNTEVTNTVAFTGNGSGSNLSYPAKHIIHTNQFSATGQDTASVAIVNVTNKNIDNGRYGDIDQYHEFISTGAYKDVDGLTSTTIDVWGGDCYIGLYTFKLTDRTYSIPSATRASAGTDDANVLLKWKRQYDTGWSGHDDWLRPVGLNGVAQTISIWLESEVNPASIDYNVDTTRFSSSHPYPLPDSDASTDILVPYSYKANLSMSMQNELKIWIPRDKMDRDLEIAASRIAYSDQKVYNADIEGFDRFRALSIYDLDESLGKLTKLITVDDSLYAIQENSYAYVPIDSSIIETADAANLAVRAGEIIGIPKYLSTSLGSQHQRTIVQGNHSLFFFDYKNKLIVRSRQGEEQFISEIGVIDGINDIDNVDLHGVRECDISAFYDERNRKYILSKKYVVDSVDGDVAGFTWVFDERTGVWVSKWCEGGASEASINGGVQTMHGEVFLLGKVLGASNDIYLSSMYTGNIGTFFGIAQPAYFSYVVNPMPDLPKTFDSIIINSDSEVSDLTMSVPINDGVSYTTTISDFDDVESLYKAKVLRNTTSIGGKTGQRMRGRYGYCTINFDQTQQTSITSILTRVRPSNRGI